MAFVHKQKNQVVKIIVSHIFFSKWHQGDQNGAENGEDEKLQAKNKQPAQLS